MKVEIGTASAAPGEKSYGRLNVAKTMARFDVFIPVIIINGVEEGPTFIVSGAVHGDEILGSIAILKVAQNLDPAKLKGTFIGVPVTNVAAFEMLDRATFWDGKILNRVTPNKDGTITEQLRYAFHNEIVNRVTTGLTSTAVVIQMCGIPDIGCLVQTMIRILIPRSIKR